MAVREILLLRNPILRAKCGKVEKFNDDITGTIIDLRDTLEKFRSLNGFGKGIAAPQIRLLKKIIFIQTDRPMILINQEITGRSKQKMTLWDDCFSFPEIVVKVKRHTKIKVRYTDAQGKKQVFHAVGGLSELLQHEIDHINGILATDRAVDSKHIILKSEWEKFVHTPKNTF